MITVVSTNSAPIALGASPTHTISGTVVLAPATDDETVFMAAKQTFGGGPVTVGSLPAQLVDGPTTGDSSYSLALPTGPPLLGPYSALLPIAFTAQPGISGQYAVQASAAGYASQSFNKDISAADQAQNFTLVP